MKGFTPMMYPNEGNSYKKSNKRNLNPIGCV